MAGSIKNTLENLDLTNDEIDRFTKAFKDDEFKKLFMEYAQEISDPENRRKYEEEIAMMEADRGMDVQFVHPNPGYVIKTIADGKTKIFINIATNDLVGKPSHQRSNEQGKPGLFWSIPHIFAHPREDLDKSRQECRVYDVVFHPDTYRMAESNVRFRKIVEDTAIDGIENQFGIKVDRCNYKKPKMKYKGRPAPTVIRKRKENGKPQGSGDNIDENEKSVLDNMPYPYTEGKTTEEISQERLKNANENVSQAKNNNNEKVSDNDSKYATPTYKLKYGQDLELSDFGTFGQPQDMQQARSRRPDRVIVEIDLPLIKSAGSVDLDIGERSLSLISEKPAAYHLMVNFSYPVREEGGSAKFDKKARQLVVTLPIVPDKNLSMSLPKSDDSLDTPDETKEENESKMVTVLSSSESHEQADNNEESKDPVENTETTPVSDDMKERDPLDIEIVEMFEPIDPAKFTNELPECRYREDNKCISLLFEIRNVQVTSFKLSRDSKGYFQFKFTSLGSGGWPIEYCFCLKVGYKNNNPVNPFDKQLCNADSILENFVVSFRKLPEFHNQRASGVYLSHDLTQWSNVRNNEEATNLKTSDLLLDEICQLFEEKNSITTAPTDDEKRLIVSELSEKCLSIQIESFDINEIASVDFPGFESVETDSSVDQEGRKPMKMNANQEQTNELLKSSSSIEVVYKNPPPNLHGILKKTSSQSSESNIGELKSDDDCCCQCTSADDIRGFHKSVSFSGRPEVTNYNCYQPVCSFHTTLKNRKRKNKRREQRRRVASGSSMSTEEDEEVLHSFRNMRSGAGGRSAEPRQRHYSDSILVTEGQGFIDSDDFTMQESGDDNVLSSNDSCDKQTQPQSSTVTFETKKNKRRKRKEQVPESTATPTEAPDCDSQTSKPDNEEVNSPTKQVSFDSTITTVDPSDKSDEHRTNCRINFENSTIFELDDD